MSSYFLSYSRVDQAVALKLAADLAAAGLSIWVDQQHIQPSQHWDRAIETALRGCDGVVVVLSPSAAASPNVADEVSLALDAGKRVIPFMVAACAPPLRMTRIQYIDGVADYGAGLRRMVETLGGSLDGLATSYTAPAAATVVLEDPVLERAERHLTPLVGPIAGRLVRRAAEGAATIEALSHALSKHLASDADVEAFRKAVGATPPAIATPSTSIPPDEVKRIGEILIKHLGPIGPRLVVRESADAASVEALCRRLAARLPDAKAQAAFLKEAGFS